MLKLKQTVATLLFIPSLLSAAETGKINYEATAGGALKQGNVEKFDGKASASINRVDSVFSFELFGKLAYSTIDKNKMKDNRREASAKIDLFEFSKWSPFLAVEYLYDEKKGYNQLGALAGEKYRIYHKENVCDYSVSLALMFNNEEHLTNHKQSNSDKLLRLSVRPKIKQRIAEGVMLKEQFFYQPRLKFDDHDYLLKNVSELEFKVNRILYIDLDFIWEHRNKVPSYFVKERDGSVSEHNYMKDDITFDFAFKFKF